jgi:hypothetical protein
MNKYSRPLLFGLCVIAFACVKIKSHGIVVNIIHTISQINEISTADTGTHGLHFCINFTAE